MKLIGINGLMGSGKDTLFGLIALEAAAAGLRAERRAFADKLKVLAAAALGFEGTTEESIEFCNKLKQPGVRIDAFSTAIGSGPSLALLTGREYLQNFGQKHRVHVSDSFWVDVVLPTPVRLIETRFRAGANACNIADMFDNADICCVTDVRYENEAERVLQLGGIVVEVLRDSVKSDGHSSEKRLPLELVTHTVPNNGTFADLRKHAGYLIA